MNMREKRKFVRDLIKSIQASIEERLVDTPDDWDGVELRQYIADTFSDRAGAMSFQSGTLRDRKRLNEYRNTVLVRNL